MTLTEFTRKFAREYDVDVDMAHDWIAPIFDFMREQILENNEFSIPRLGVFKHICEMPRQYRDMRTGEMRMSQPHMVLEFSVNESLMKEVRSLTPDESLSRKNRKQERLRPNKKYKAKQDNIMAYAENGGAYDGQEDAV